LFVVIKKKKLAIAIPIANTIFAAMLLYPPRSGYDTRAWSKLHGVFGCSFLRPSKKTENTKNRTEQLLCLWRRIVLTISANISNL